MAHIWVSSSRLAHPTWNLLDLIAPERGTASVADRSSNVACHGSRTADYRRTAFQQPTFCFSIINPSPTAAPIIPPFEPKSIRRYVIVGTWRDRKNSTDVTPDLSPAGKLVFTLRRLRSLRCPSWTKSLDFAIGAGYPVRESGPRTL